MKKKNPFLDKLMLNAHGELVPIGEFTREDCEAALRTTKLVRATLKKKGDGDPGGASATQEALRGAFEPSSVDVHYARAARLGRARVHQEANCRIIDCDEL